MFVCFLQMSDNRRQGGRRAQQEQKAPQDEAPQQQLPPPPLMTIEQIFLMQTQAVQAIGQTGSNTTSVATATSTSTSTASADAADAEGQAGKVHERSSPCVCPFCRPQGRRRLVVHSEARAAYRLVQ
jgi:hypothetical protein